MHTVWNGYHCVISDVKPCVIPITQRPVFQIGRVLLCSSQKHKYTLRKQEEGRSGLWFGMAGKKDMFEKLLSGLPCQCWQAGKTYQTQGMHVEMHKSWKCRGFQEWQQLINHWSLLGEVKASRRSWKQQWCLAMTSLQGPKGRAMQWTWVGWRQMECGLYFR